MKAWSSSLYVDYYPTIEVDLADPFINHRNMIQAFEKSPITPRRAIVVINNVDKPCLSAITQLCVDRL